MAFQPVPETASIELIFTGNGVVMQNVLYAKKVGGYVLADLQALADAVGTYVGGNFRPRQAPEITFVRTEVRGLALENDLVATSTNGAGPGTEVSRAMPNNVTFAIKRMSGLTGRSARGRTYWIGVPSDKPLPGDENRLQATYIASIVANLDGVRTTIEALAGWDPVLVSRVSGGIKRPTGITFPWTGTIETDDRVDTMRSRLPPG